MKMYLELCIVFLAYLLFGLVIVLSTSEMGNVFFVWNAFLAFLPLLFARMLGKYLNRNTKKKSVVLILAVLWLLFFPNAPYMVTDLLYFGNTSYFVNNGYTTSVLAWAKLVYIAFGVLLGSLMGLKSMYEMHQIIRRHKGKKIAYSAILVSCLLSGFAIYIGRILRFNSWDVLRPLYMLTRINEELSAFSLIFSLLFAVYTLGSYILFYILFHNSDNKADEGQLSL